MEKYGIKNVSQIKTWMKRYRTNQIHRFDQPIGKQYSYIKSEEFQYTKYHSLSSQEVVACVNDYMYHYNNERIQEKLDYYSPSGFRGRAA